MCSDTKEVKLTFLHPHGPATPSSSGRVYSLTKKEMTAAKERLDSAT